MVTWPKSLDQLPPMMDYNIRDGRTYMYFKGEPLYPFGYGLSYTTFKYANLRTSSPQVAKDGAVKVSVDVTNTGSRAGDAVVQLYVKHLGSKVARPGEELKGFKRVGPSARRDEDRGDSAAGFGAWVLGREDLRIPGGSRADTRDGGEFVGGYPTVYRGAGPVEGGQLQRRTR